MKTSHKRVKNFIRIALSTSMIGAMIALTSLSSCSSSSSTSTASVETETTVQGNAQDSIKTGGSSSTVDFLNTLETAYAATANSTPTTLLEPSQSENIIAGIKQKLVDVGAISKTLNPKDNDGTLEFRVVAKDALLVATHHSVSGVTNLTTTDLQAIYSGTLSNWQQLGGPDAEIVVLDRPEDESAKRLLRQYYLGADLPNAANAVVLRKEGELIETLQSTPYSIGAFSLAYAFSHRLPVNHLKLNGVAPTSATLTTGQYPMKRTIGVVWHKDATEATQAFISYIFSPAGTDALERAGFAPISPSAQGE
ncbi:MAG: substrate-binding domain-containing protein [Oscillatoriophycideae cyanobacterium NC_groundwater_1537_Pr4_S-0.65um_50_18]|nr:substrate-binding domain-containing protein [Oscillatoriophycideae cyanobacterium NC_groundwater_1537_Pr4_S-0.65um_50_18]